MSTASQRRRGSRQKDLVGFRIGDVAYAVDIHRVREILNPLPTVELPQAPPSVIGVADHRGDVVPIIDLRRRFQLEPKPITRRTKWVVVDRRGMGVALVVDRVTDVFGAGPAEQRNVPDLTRKRGIQAVFSHDSVLVFVLDVDQVTDAVAELSLDDLPEVP